MKNVLLPLLLLFVMASGCDMLSNEDAAPSPMAVKFEVAPSTGGASKAALQANAVGDPLVIAGTNGIITLTDARMIVEKFKLGRQGYVCNDDDDNSTDDNGDCRTVHAPPSFVQLPLTGGTVTVSDDNIPAGTYTRLKFKVDDLDLSDDDEDEYDDSSEHQAAQELFETIRAEFPDWPEDASMMLVGTFTPTGGVAQPFTLFAEAEIKVDMALDPPLVVGADPASDITVEIDPVMWVTKADGTVINLAELGNEDDLFEFEIKIKEGFSKVKTDDDDDDDQDDDGDDD